MIPPARYLTLLIPILILIASLACSDDAAPGDCIDAARNAGVPDRVVEWMKDPVEEWGTIERIAIREALEKFGIGEFCSDVEDKLAMAESSAMNNALEVAKSAVNALTPSPEPPIPTPRPTPRLPSTPMPADTAVPAPTSIPSEPHAVRITHVTFSGTAGKPGSRFNIHFNHPVAIQLSPNFDHDYDDSPVRLIVGHPDNYDDRLSYYNTSDLPVSGIALRSRQPTDKLSFGPIEKEFLVAYYLVGADSLRKGDGSPAFDRQLIQLPGNTVFLNPDHSTDVNDLSLVSCVAFMEFVGIPSPVMRSVKEMSSESLTDSEREEWRRFLQDGEYIRYSELWELSSLWEKEPCAALWSEDHNERNTTKRNRDWEEDCLDDGFAHDDMLTLANRPYADLDTTDRIVLQMIMDDSDCRVFYPQLFYGRWIPMSANQ